MQKYLIDILLCTVYGIFLLGASGSFCNNGSKKTVWVMISAISMNTCITLLFVTRILTLGSEIRNPLLDFTLLFGILFVWTTFLGALVFRIKKSMHFFHTLIAAVEICWFFEIVLFIYSKHRFPVF